MNIAENTGLQICNRCRKKKIRCDLQLPCCKNCRLADSECLFWDDSLGEDVPCSYLYALRLKVSSLQREIKQLSGSSASITAQAASPEAIWLPGQDYHLTLRDDNDSSNASLKTYLGPQSCARLLERLTKAVIQLHLERNKPLPGRLLPDQTYRAEGIQSLVAVPSFTVLHDQRKEELYAILPPSTQRALVRHYMNAMSSEYPLLPIGQESALLALENPLKAANSSKDDPVFYMINIVFAVSTTLVARDLEPNLSGIAKRCREDLARLYQSISIPGNRIEQSKWTCRVLCTLAILEAINPISGQLWDFLGAAISSLEELHEGCKLEYPILNEDYQGIEYSILKLEWAVQLHFGRISSFHDMVPRLIITSIPELEKISQELNLLSCLQSISRTFISLPHSSAHLLENLIPLSHRVESAIAEIEIQSATLYVALHPLFTTSMPFPDEVMTAPAANLFSIVAHSASSVIDHLYKLNASNNIVSLWMAAERVLESGAIWATYLIHQHRSGTGARSETRVAMSPILKVSSLLASFGTRWKAGSEFVNAWEVLVELLWEVL